jgi:hypothetical protein
MRNTPSFDRTKEEGWQKGWIYRTHREILQYFYFYNRKEEPQLLSEFDLVFRAMSCGFGG